MSWLGGYFESWHWDSAFRYNRDSRTELCGGIVDNNALRAALLDTNPVTAFNPFGLNQNSPEVINKVFVTTHHLGESSLTLQYLKLYGDLILPSGANRHRNWGEHRTEQENDQPDALTASGQTTGELKLSVAPNLLRPKGPVPLTRGNRDVWSIYWEVRVPVPWAPPGTASVSIVWN